MKIIHCADIHLDSSMTKNFDAEHARIRRSEILNTFIGMIDYAKEHEVAAILIAGDLFDTDRIAKTTRATIENLVRVNSDILFFYLRGNHDLANALFQENEVPANWKTFSDQWTSYYLFQDGRVYSKEALLCDIQFKSSLAYSVCITGMETADEEPEAYANQLMLEDYDLNLVMVHGNPASLQSFRGKFIDYMACGHIHSYQYDRLDGRGTYCYPGCLEGRGFDEIGNHGFVLLDVNFDTKEIRSEFIPFAKRNIYEFVVDVSNCENSIDIVDACKSAEMEQLENIDSTMDMARFVLVGEMDAETEKDETFIKENLSAQFYYVKLQDQTRYKLDAERFRYDETLRGEFVRMVLSDETLDEDTKSQVLRYGLLLFEHEEV